MSGEGRNQNPALITPTRGVKKLKRGLETIIFERELLTGLGFSVESDAGYRNRNRKTGLTEGGAQQSPFRIWLGE